MLSFMLLSGSHNYQGIQEGFLLCYYQVAITIKESKIMLLSGIHNYQGVQEGFLVCNYQVAITIKESKKAFFYATIRYP